METQKTVDEKDLHLTLGPFQRRQISEIIRTGRYKTGAEIARKGIDKLWKEVMEECV